LWSFGVSGVLGILGIHTKQFSRGNDELLRP
jgi:hypothetical protein